MDLKIMEGSLLHENLAWRKIQVKTLCIFHDTLKSENANSMTERLKKDPTFSCSIP